MLGKSRWRLIRTELALVLAPLLIGSLNPAAAFTDKEAREIFDVLDHPDHDSKVTKVKFDLNKMEAFYLRRAPDRTGKMKPLTFEQTGMSREFFDKIDQNHKGYIDGVDIVEGIRYQDIDTTLRGYFDFADFVTFLNKIGR